MVRLRRKKRAEQAKQIKNLATKALEGNKFGHSTNKIRQLIRPSLDFSPTQCQVGQCLAICENIEKVGRASGSTGGGTWILKEELQQEEADDCE